MKLKELDDKIKALEEAYENVVGTPTECYQRITGYARSVNLKHPEINTWNPGKMEEFKDRKQMKISKAKRNIKYKEVQRG